MRALTIAATGQADGESCQTRVIYEQAHRLAKALETNYTVMGWREEDGTLWQPNKMVRVRDGVIGFDTDLLIVEANWILDKEGMRTQLRVGPQSGYLTKPDKKAIGVNWAGLGVV